MEKGVEVAVEEVSKVALSESVSGVVQQYSLLGDLKASAVKGMERARRDRSAGSPPRKPSSGLLTDRQPARKAVGAEMADLEEVPIIDEGEED